MNEQSQWWASEAGDAYTARNRVPWGARREFWGAMMRHTQVRSVYEVGCNAGWNLSAIKAHAYLPSMPAPTAIGCDVNPIAVARARAAGLDVYQGDALSALMHFQQPTFDLVFTAGVLIHIPDDTLPLVMSAIVKASAQYVLAIEYEGDGMIEYRGELNRLWKRPYGKLYEDLGLRFVDAGDPGPGFDRCTWWLMEKV